MKTIVFATHNENKMKEIREIVKNIPGFEKINLISMRDAGITEDIVEDGNSYEENALIKAKFVCEKTGMIALADDSGIEIDAFDGNPGIYSARFLGEDTPYGKKCEYILDKMSDLPDEKRRAKYMCFIAAAFPDKTSHVEMGVLNGMIAYRPSNGRFGFAYDKIMYIPEINKTVAEATMEEKNEIGHRGQAIRKMCKWLLEENK